MQLGNTDDLPLDGRLVFFLKSTVPARFPRNEKVELAAVDGSFDTELSLADGSLMLEDAKTAMGNIEPLNRLGASAFGPIHVRALSAEGAAGDWLPLGTLVRLPGFKDLRCPHAVAKPCVLTGTNLFLAASIAATPDFDNPTDVPPEFPGTQLTRSTSRQRNALPQAARRSRNCADAQSSRNVGGAGSLRVGRYPEQASDSPACRVFCARFWRSGLSSSGNHAR